MNDFNTLISTDYTVTGTSSTFALTSGVGGMALITPGGTTTATVAYKAPTSFQFQAGNRFWYTTRFQASGVGANSFYAGLQAGSSASDGIWFRKVASSALIDLVSVIGGTTTVLIAGLTTVTAATFVELGLYYNGTDLIVYVANAGVARISGFTIGTNVTSALLGPVFQMTPAATETMTIDFVGVAQEIAR